MSEPTAHLRDWIGRELTREDQVTIAPIVALSATLDRDDPAPRSGNPLPPLWHWLFFLPRTPTRELGADGHTTLGGFMPPVGLPRRMWAGSRFTFEDALRVGDTMRRISRVADVTEKTGASGRLVFVTVEHEIRTTRGVAIREAQDIVYRDLPKQEAASATPEGAAGNPETSSVATSQEGGQVALSDALVVEPDGAFHRTITPDPVLLFRYSALTFNSHRIHYDRRHVTEVEGYPGLLVHGPLLATLLLDLLRRAHPEARVRDFRFKAKRPVFDIAPFTIIGKAHNATAMNLWALDNVGEVAVEATVTIA